MTTLDAVAVRDRLRTTYRSGRTRDPAWRDAQLDALKRMLTEREDELVAAIQQDLGRPRYEAFAADLQVALLDIRDIRRSWRRWAHERRHPVPAVLQPARAAVRYEPLGTVLVIAPWNYPVVLLVSPLAAAIAAGNTAVCKPSEMTPTVSALLTRLAGKYLDPDAIAFVEGGVAESTALLEQQWDHIFFTGSGGVGRIVMAAAARHLTPVTLELGGRSPTIVCADANVRLAADRVASGRWFNAGQTCIAPNHVFVHTSVEQEFLDLLATALRKRYGADPRTSPDLGRIVDERQARRLADLLAGGGYDEVVYGGTVDVPGRYLAPTVLRGVKPDAPVMQEEIFGPILPVVRFDDLDEVIRDITEGDKPLSLYLFTGDEDVVERVLDETSSGSACVNDTVVQFATRGLRFGGVGASGTGAYHGRSGFETFSHARSVFRRPPWWRELPMLRPPYKPWKAALVRRLLR